MAESYFRLTNTFPVAKESFYIIRVTHIEKYWFMSFEWVKTPLAWLRLRSAGPSPGRVYHYAPTPGRCWRMCALAEAEAELLYWRACAASTSGFLIEWLEWFQAKESAIPYQHPYPLARCAWEGVHFFTMARSLMDFIKTECNKSGTSLFHFRILR